MSQRVATFVVGSLIAVALAVVGFSLDVPYVELAPGPTYNTLGVNPSGTQIITIRGHATYPTAGHLNMLTVSVNGGPPSPIRLATALRGWLDKSIAIVPQSVIYPPGVDPQEVQQQDVLDMLQSQDSSETVALDALGYHVRTQVRIEDVFRGMPASTALVKGDVIVAVDGKSTPTADRLRKLLSGRHPGDRVEITFRRGARLHTVRLRTVSQGGRAVIGILPRDAAVLPFPIEIDLGGVEGPSAGMMLALGIYDKLTPGALTGGRFIAGTGTIDVTGAVGAIGGIQQKIVAAEDAGAQVFLVPSDNCADAKSVANKHMELARVSTFRQALAILAKVRANRTDIPHC